MQLRKQRGLRRGQNSYLDDEGQTRDCKLIRAEQRNERKEKEENRSSLDSGGSCGAVRRVDALERMVSSNE